MLLQAAERGCGAWLFKSTTDRKGQSSGKTPTWSRQQSEQKEKSTSLCGITELRTTSETAPFLSPLLITYMTYLLGAAQTNRPGISDASILLIRSFLQDLHMPVSHAHES